MRMSPRRLVAVATLTLTAAAGPTWGQLEPPENGMRPSDLRTHAIVDARVVVKPGTVLERATVLVRDGIIAEVGPDLAVPADARRWESAGLTVYAGLIEPALLVDAGPRPEAPGRHWNDAIHPELRAVDRDLPAAADREALRKLGFTTAVVYPNRGILRGSGAVLALGDAARDRDALVARGPMIGSFERAGSWGEYPSSKMGSVALMRQTLLDAQWHAAAVRTFVAHPEGLEPPITSPPLQALADVTAGAQPLLFEADDELDALRAGRLAEEFDLSLVLLGSGMEFRRLDEVVALGAAVIAPLDFPDAPSADSVHAADDLTLRELMTWEQAPTNPRRLLGAGATVALTTHGLSSRGDYAARVRRAMKQGLTFDQALAAFTTVPATLYGLGDIVGTVETGKLANLVVLEGALFESDATVRTVWVDGRPYEIEPAPRRHRKLEGELRASDGHALTITIDPLKSSLTLERGEGDDAKRYAGKSVKFVGDQVSAAVEGAAFDADGWVRLTAVIVTTADTQLVGNGLRDDGHRFSFNAAMQPVRDAAPEGEAGEDAEDGAEDEANDAPDDDGVSGTWSLHMTVANRPDPVAATLELAWEAPELTGTLDAFDEHAELRDGTFDPGRGVMHFTFTGPYGLVTADAELGPGRLEGAMAGGYGVVSFVGTRAGQESKTAPEDEPAPEEFVTPLGAYGLHAAPQPEDVLVYNATIWTSGPAGVLERADLLVEDGRIVAVGRDLSPRRSDTRLIDASGKHVTAGLIDCHSHTGANGVNEGGQANTAEVRIRDVLVADDISWYRELAGGLTAANVLHGSANPIGGQNAVVKIKWGGRTTDLRIDSAPEGIKFALGENVKRSEGRYPDTRMGVETFIRDAFTAARAYREAWDHYLALPEEIRNRTIPPRRDLELDALAEVLAGDRLVHCHSYRQDEILALIRIADDFGFRLGTLQHVLEGYKVADAIAQHGVGASSFSDWWAYKVEVMDAIPYNGALMADVGVVVSYNSDSSELARRMNTEAAKAVRYGGMEPAEALKLVTINPARQLGVDDRMGSLEAGKDADFVIWSGDPLSTYTRCEETWIEGAQYFSLERDAELREETTRERTRLLAKVSRQAFGDGGGRGGGSGRGSAGRGRRRGPPMSDELIARSLRWIDEAVRLGRDAGAHLCGDCGCDDVAEAVRRWREEESR